MCAVGGYSVSGKNMSALRVGNEVIIIDMGVNIESLVTYEAEEGSTKNLSTEKLMNIGAIPNDRVIADWVDDVKGIILGHCHLDHIAAVQYLAPKYNCPIFGSSFSLSVLKEIFKDDKISIHNKFKSVELDSKFKVSKNISVELISCTHSTMQCAIVAIHTPEGVIIYANDFKFDDHPVIGNKTNYKRLEELGKSGEVIALICNSLYANTPGSTPSENVARELVKDALLDNSHSGAVFITTFSSHIQRLHSIIEFGRKMNRKVIILGRSMAKYIHAAENVGIIDFSSKSEIFKYGRERIRMLKEINANREKYIVICTGGQGEPGSILDKIVNNELPFNFKEGDSILFSCNTIPVPLNMANRARLEASLKTFNVSIFSGLHSSGHAFRDDKRKLIKMVNPKVLIPCHGDANQESSLVDLACEMGFKLDVSVFQLHNGQKLVLNE